MSELTKWFSSNVKPVRRGFYNTNSGLGDDGFAYWNGEYWSPEWPSIDGARISKNSVAGYQRKRWRGLASDPNKGKK